jgi:REP-associated tyrosine transposase
MYDWRKMTLRERKDALGVRRSEGHPWHGPPRSPDGDGVFHLSAACYEHAPIIGRNAERLRDFESKLLDTVNEHCDSTNAWCVLPNHYHLLVETRELRDVTKALGELHGRSSFEWNGADACRGRKVWHRCSDRKIRSERHLWAAMNYVHHNAVHHGYVERWEDWPFSSAVAYLEEMGRDRAKDIWEDFPVLDFGKGWDDPKL